MLHCVAALNQNTKYFNFLNPITHTGVFYDAMYTARQIQRNFGGTAVVYDVEHPPYVSHIKEKFEEEKEAT